MIKFIEVSPLALSCLSVPKTISNRGVNNFNPCDTPADTISRSCQLKVYGHYFIRWMVAIITRVHVYSWQFIAQSSTTIQAVGRPNTYNRSATKDTREDYFHLLTPFHNPMSLAPIALREQRLYFGETMSCPKQLIHKISSAHVDNSPWEHRWCRDLRTKVNRSTQGESLVKIAKLGA